VPGALAAALVDFEGETVDYAGDLDAFSMRVAAAHFRILLEDAVSQPHLHDVTSVMVRSVRRTYLIHAMAEGYALVVLFGRGAGFSGWQRALTACAHRLSSEAGWAGVKPAWFPVEVVADARLRPLRVKAGKTERSVEVLGAVAQTPVRRERAWRVRVDTGIEAMLVREPGGSWYADEPLGDGKHATDDSR
jgi:hypothetical protein